MQKGSVAGYVIVGLAVVGALIWSGFRIFADTPTEEIPQNSQSESESRGSERETNSARSFLVFDSNFAYSGDTVYYRSGTTSSGEPEYLPLPSANPDTFRKIGSASPQSNATPAASQAGGGTSGSSNSLLVYGIGFSNGTVAAQGSGQSSGVSGVQSSLGSTAGGGGSYSVSYYSDGQYVYMVVESSDGSSTPQIVPGADPDTFEILNAEYAADKDHVYVVIVSCTNGSCSAIVSIVESADPGTFQVFASEQELVNANCSGTVTADAQDQNYVYNNGQVVDGISVYLIGAGGDCDDTPVLISP